MRQHSSFTDMVEPLQVWMNGAPLGERFKQRNAYVAQEELFMPTLDAYETLEFQAALRNRAGVPKAQLRERMQDVMTVMGLGQVQHTQVRYFSDCSYCL